MAYTNILTEIRGRVALVTLNRPKALNALNDALMDELGEAVLGFDRDDGISAIVITGSEKAFAAGADIGAMKDWSYMDVYRAEYITRNWEALKRAEKGEQGLPPSALDGIPRSMPALRAAEETLRRARDAGYRQDPVVNEDQPGAAILPLPEDGNADSLEREAGELLLRLSRLGVERGLDLETALERATRRFSERFRRFESDRPAAADGAEAGTAR